MPRGGRATSNASRSSSNKRPEANDISDREIEQYLRDQQDMSFLNRPNRSRNGERDAKMDAMANTAARGASLQEELMRQWDLVEAPDNIRRARRDPAGLGR